MNSTSATSNIQYPPTDIFVACILSAILALISVAISSVILIVIWRTKPRLHTLRHLLVCNTCSASILYCIVQSINYAFLLFLPWITSDFACRWRGYLSYITIAAVLYSFFIQAISRLFISLFSRKYKWLATFKVHYILICIQWVIAIILPLPAIVTEDIYFRPGALCWVPFKQTLHLIYSYMAYYVIPALTICIIYLFIYYRVKKISNSADPVVRAVQKGKRDLELLRNILILLGIYLLGGIPSILFIITNIRIIYLIGVATITLFTAVEKICTIFLDREIQKIVKMAIMTSARVEPAYNTQKDQATLAIAQ